ncbi:hypothetical protein Micbo1qcDRAFT_175649 [Microdochium bolleyi]|uniref:Uncharacterized protein n=1 Tax=Microdochium bolleyi TaxID=196109 RepID=A0A136J2I6_9PEZI|nr:hypothetical protein Micbo1qcDRAFT_175649 [Microdochium bolleyi]
MCRITRLRCQVCQPRWSESDAAKSTPSSTYRFRPCARVKRLATSSATPTAPATTDALPHGTRLHCPTIVWPLPPLRKDSKSSSSSSSAVVEESICDTCLHAGVTHYHWTVREKQLEALRVKTYGQRGAGRTSSSTTEISTSSSSVAPILPWTSDTFVLPPASEVKGSFPPQWDTLVSNEMRSRVFKEYLEQPHKDSDASNTFMVDALPEPDWAPRLSEGPHRHLTLWIPCCKLCRQPTMRTDDAGRSHGFDGLEFEPNSILWKWLGRLSERPGVTTTITTGFLHKPCEACVTREVALRGQVGRFLRETDIVQGWAVWHWLVARGGGHVDFWHHELANVALPAGRCWEYKFYMTLMAEGWWTRTGVAWEDVGELDPPTTQKALPMTTHGKTVLVSLDQWQSLAAMLAPADRHPPPPPLGELSVVEEDEAMADAPEEIQDREPEQSRVIRRSVTTAIDELGIRQADPRELPQGYKAKLQHCGKIARRFVTFRGICVDPATGKVVKMQADQENEAAQDTGSRRGPGGPAAGEPLPKRRREDNNSHQHDYNGEVGLLPPTTTSMVDGYPSPEGTHAAGPAQDEEADEGMLVKCRCGYSHIHIGARKAKATWSVQLGLRED